MGNCQCNRRDVWKRGRDRHRWRRFRLGKSGRGGWEHQGNRRYRGVEGLDDRGSPSWQDGNCDKNGGGLRWCGWEHRDNRQNRGCTGLDDRGIPCWRDRSILHRGGGQDGSSERIGWCLCRWWGGQHEIALVFVPANLLLSKSRRGPCARFKPSCFRRDRRQTCLRTQGSWRQGAGRCGSWRAGRRHRPCCGTRLPGRDCGDGLRLHRPTDILRRWSHGMRMLRCRRRCFLLSWDKTGPIRGDRWSCILKDQF